MCQVCNFKKAQRVSIEEIGNLMSKREKAFLVGEQEKAEEIKPILLGLFEQLLNDQQKLPNLIESTDLDTIRCLLSKKEEQLAKCGF